MIESPFMNEVRIEKQKDILRRAIRSKSRSSVPVELVALIDGSNDLAELDRWIDAAVASSNLEEFRTAIGHEAIVLPIDDYFGGDNEIARRWGENIHESPFMNECREEGRRDALMEVWRKIIRHGKHHRFGNLPADLVAVIEESRDVSELDRWFDAYCDVYTIDEFRAAIEPLPTFVPSGVDSWR